MVLSMMEKMMKLKLLCKPVKTQFEPTTKSRVILSVIFVNDVPITEILHVESYIDGFMTPSLSSDSSDLEPGEHLRSHFDVEEYVRDIDWDEYIPYTDELKPLTKISDEERFYEIIFESSLYWTPVPYSGNPESVDDGPDAEVILKNVKYQEIDESQALYFVEE